MKKIYNKSDVCIELCQSINCDDDMIERTLEMLIEEEFGPDARCSFDYPDDDTIEVKINTRSKNR